MRSFMIKVILFTLSLHSPAWSKSSASSSASSASAAPSTASQPTQPVQAPVQAAQQAQPAQSAQATQSTQAAQDTPRTTRLKSSLWARECARAPLAIQLNQEVAAEGASRITANLAHDRAPTQLNHPCPNSLHNQPSTHPSHQVENQKEAIDAISRPFDVASEDLQRRSKESVRMVVDAALQNFKKTYPDNAQLPTQASVGGNEEIRKRYDRFVSLSEEFKKKLDQGGEIASEDRQCSMLRRNPKDPFRAILNQIETSKRFVLGRYFISEYLRKASTSPDQMKKFVSQNRTISSEEHSLARTNLADKEDLAVQDLKQCPGSAWLALKKRFLKTLGSGVEGATCSPEQIAQYKKKMSEIFDQLAQTLGGETDLGP